MTFLCSSDSSGEIWVCDRRYILALRARTLRTKVFASPKASRSDENMDGMCSSTTTFPVGVSNFRNTISEKSMLIPGTCLWMCFVDELVVIKWVEKFPRTLTISSTDDVELEVEERGLEDISRHLDTANAMFFVRTSESSFFLLKSVDLNARKALYSACFWSTRLRVPVFERVVSVYGVA